MNTLERRMKRIKELTPKPPRKVEVIFFTPDEETEEEAFARARVNLEDPDTDFIIVLFVNAGHSLKTKSEVRYLLPRK